MARKRSSLTSSIPYYDVRYAVIAMFKRRQALWRSAIWAAIVAVGGWFINAYTNTIGSFPWLTLAAAIVGMLALVLFFVMDLITRSMDYSGEEELVEFCVEELERRAYDQDTLAAIREMAGQSSGIFQPRTTAPIIVITVFATLLVSANVPWQVLFTLALLLLMAVLSIIDVVGKAYADDILRNALIEVERRRQVKVHAPVPTHVQLPEAAPTPEAAFPAPVPVTPPAATVQTNGTAPPVS